MWAGKALQVCPFPVDGQQIANRALPELSVRGKGACLVS